MEEENIKEAVYEVQKKIYSIVATFKPGLWLINRTEKKNVYSYLCSHKDGLPEAMKLSQFDLVKYDVAKVISKYLKECKDSLDETGFGYPKTKELVSRIQNTLKTKQFQETAYE